MGKVLGIDFGTSYTSCAVHTSDGPLLVQTPEGKVHIPSMVAFDEKKRFLVGEEARRQFRYNPRDTIYGFKRFMGRKYSSHYVQKLKTIFPYEITAGPNDDVRFPLRERLFSPEEIATLLLKQVLEFARIKLERQDIREAVISVPAYFGHPQRQSIRQACADAGIYVRKILNEPTAACLNYAYGRRVREKVLVFDLGGGTFDVTLMEINGQAYKVIATGGSPVLGGLDFDHAISRHFVARLQEQHGLDLFISPLAQRQLLDTAEQVKITLSGDESTKYHLDFTGYGDVGARGIKYEGTLTRNDLSVICGDLVKRAIFIVKKTIEKAGISDPATINRIILVGGQSKMPMVRSLLERYMKITPLLYGDISLAVTKGAAIQAGVIEQGRDQVDEVVTQDVIPQSIGFYQDRASQYHLVLHNNTPVNTSQSVEIATTQDRQTSVTLELRQGDEASPGDNELIGFFEFSGLPPHPRGVVRLDVEFHVDEQGTLTVTGREKRSGREIKAKF